ncbi:MAG: septum formation protein Maf [Chitinivibrionia bacterium]|nr:septum formation protein Maf [Chitinivibrionia bacterium]
MNPFVPPRLQTGIVLASGSPRRIELMKSLGLSFIVDPAHMSVEDQELECPPHDLPLVLASLKARDVAGRHPHELVVGADTVVIIDGEVLEKPSDDRQAAEYLEKLSGRTHEVITGLAVRRHAAGLELREKERTLVRFNALTPHEIASYVASGEGRDKAGGYAIQGLGSCLVRSVNGCFYNVVGLPISLLIELLKRCGQ